MERDTSKKKIAQYASFVQGSKGLLNCVVSLVDGKRYMMLWGVVEVWV